MGSLKSPCTASWHHGSKLLIVFWENRVFCILATDGQTDRQMNTVDGQHRCTKPLRCRDRCLNKADGILTPCNVARSWHWFLQVTAPCNVTCGSGIVTVNSRFTKWQHPAIWYVALGWDAIEFAQTSAILKFCIWFRFRLHHCSRHVILHQSPKFYPNRTTTTSCRFSRWKISAILDFRDRIMGSLKCQMT